MGLRLTAGGKPLAWRRDPEDMYLLHLEVPAGVKSVEAAFDYATGPGGRGDSSPSMASARLCIIKWNPVVLYPRGADPHTLEVAASVRLPAGWTFGTALPVAAKTADGARFAPVSLETLIDSPLAAGAYGRALDLSPAGGPPHTLHLYADSPEALEMKDAVLAGYRGLTREAGALFGAYPYRAYHFLSR